MMDRNFDDLAERFAQNIYGTLKGRIRQIILWEELDQLLATFPNEPLSILDAGGGIGQISSGLAQRGHQITLCDVSEQMLIRAKQHAQEQGVASQMTFIQTSAQQVGTQLEKPVDIVLFHAVLEWVAEPEKTLAALFDTLSPGGVLSLMFYNLHGLTLQNLTLGNFGYLKAHMKKRKKKTLSPDYPRDPAEVDQWLMNVGFDIESKAGIRVFSDFIRDLPPSANGEEGIIEMERRYSRQEPFMSLGRYIHVTARKPAIKDEL
ncbi:tRNA uridine 5-oxyacetic acid(34) methyltransferase CmoM [Tatumella sp. OPLPL6]|uniref:tRNA uridine 5-oxyacetic acid(34) methyltransferase CmoM n=1 Tax=Tatumella sp. OPLPL6 TaxID=1928657 RepID=UPI000C19AB2D|nr:tRNA uridine 5-oxyacetic acid(34) methyltransferase CmoM [Tatumella sp. OPLPL6]PIJ45840.1 tRNA uridine 5-oxyacetic acid(34) methyltransferase CmoM [Tatumella sp. OPLPL6]